MWRLPWGILSFKCKCLLILGQEQQLICFQGHWYHRRIVSFRDCCISLRQEAFWVVQFLELRCSERASERLEFLFVIRTISASAFDSESCFKSFSERGGHEKKKGKAGQALIAYLNVLFCCCRCCYRCRLCAQREIPKIDHY